jgi:hypothetical protein
VPGRADRSVGAAAASPVDAARALGARIAAGAEQVERERRLPPELVATLGAALRGRP